MGSVVYPPVAGEGGDGIYCLEREETGGEMDGPPSLPTELGEWAGDDPNTWARMEGKAIVFV